MYGKVAQQDAHDVGVAWVNQQQKDLLGGNPNWEDDDPELEKNGGPYKYKASFLQVTFRLPETSKVNLIAVCYGFLPFVVSGTFFISALLTHRFVFIYGTLLGIANLIITEAIFKPLFHDPRPHRTANRKPDGTLMPGLPSGHCTNVFSMLFWCLWEVSFHDELNIEWLVLVLIFMAPVPWARFHNGDHTFFQCWSSSILGACIGTGAFIIRTKIYPNHWWPWVEYKASWSPHLPGLKPMFVAQMAKVKQHK